MAAGFDPTFAGSNMIVLEKAIRPDELREIAERSFGDFVKAVVDVERDLMAVDAELHADLESALIERGSSGRMLWGINLYPELSGDDFVEFDSMINMRPSEGNPSRGVEDKEIRRRIKAVVAKWIAR